MWCGGFCVFFKQKTAYEMRISDWSSDVCSSDLPPRQSALRPEARTRRMVSDTIRRGGGACRTTHMEWAAPDVAAPRPSPPSPTSADRKSAGEGQSVSVSVHLGGRRILEKKNNTPIYTSRKYQSLKTNNYN